MDATHAAMAKDLQKPAPLAASAQGGECLIYSHSEAQDALRIRMIDHRQDGTRTDSIRSEKNPLRRVFCFLVKAAFATAIIAMMQSYNYMAF
ncbi:hypothetical protein MCB86_14420 [Pseudomonas sp. KSR10]|uniref:hypothetical protein n=1 Tax=Pseudomonas sp. KSR10 TaxID=2916654 RepID=UPI001EF9B04A|nr:hypothetical protein [Pseudomonas sp. KSR10]MCG6541270.1 hypothetical protein [Pseudomonas sp. KSR10]